MPVAEYGRVLAAQCCMCVYSGAKRCLLQDIDECLSSPCQNGATCVQGDNNYTCSCPGGFQGRNCEENIDDCLGIRCQGQYSRCQDAVMSYQCVCLDGYAGVCVCAVSYTHLTLPTNHRV